MTSAAHTFPLEWLESYLFVHAILRLLLPWSNRPLVMGIAGGTASGKSTLRGLIHESLPRGLRRFAALNLRNTISLVTLQRMLLDQELCVVKPPYG